MGRGGAHLPSLPNRDEHLSHGHSIFSLQPATISLLLSDDKRCGIRYILSCVDRYGTAASLQGRKVEEAQPPPLYDPVLGRIEAAVNDDPESLIVDGME